MKGKQLYRRDILNLKDGDKVWVEYMNYDNSKDGVETIKEEKSYSSDDRFMYLTDMAEEFFENNLAVYEYIEETQTEQTITKTDKETNTYIKTYKGSEILAMIDDGRLKDDDTVVGKDGAQYLIKHLRKLAVVEILVGRSPFTIKQKPVDFMTAVNSSKNIRPVSVSQKGFHTYKYWLGYLMSNIGRTPINPLDYINDLWEIEY